MYYDALQEDGDSVSRGVWISMINLLNQQTELNDKYLQMVD